MDSTMEFILLKDEWKKYTWLSRCTIYPVMLLVMWFMMLCLLILTPVDKFVFRHIGAFCNKFVKPMFIRRSEEDDA